MRQEPAEKPHKLSETNEGLIKDTPGGSLLENSAEIDHPLTYPCYKSFDEFIDVERLISLDEYIAERISRRIKAQKDIQFYTGPYKLKDSTPDRPGSRMIYLAQSKLPDSYFDLDKTELWEPTEATAEFSLLMDFIATLPFKATGRMLIMYDDICRPVPAHRDHTEKELCHEFIWFRTNLRKPFYMLNHLTGEKQYVESYSAWFDSVNQFHGSDEQEGLSFSIRVDGVFTDKFRKRIPRPTSNLASTPAVWACASLPRPIRRSHLLKLYVDAPRCEKGVQGNEGRRDRND